MQPVYEYIGNAHIHTPYSDGEGTHAEVAQAAAQAGLDVVIVTDHNVLVQGVEGYYRFGPEQNVLLLTGEEVHDPRRQPQANHMLIYGVERELAPHAPNPQTLIEQVGAVEGSCYLAHPLEKSAPQFDEPAIPWVDWDIEGYTGIELWNYMSEFKSHLSSPLAAIRAAFSPDRFISGPFPQTLALWDQLLGEGRRVRIVGGADAHATRYALGPISRVVFPYEYLFRCVNLHILTPRPFSGDLEHDKRLVLNALRDGNVFVGYDLPASTRGFRFSAQGLNTYAIMGNWLRVGNGVTLQIACPQIGQTRLIHDGKVVLQENEGTHSTYIATRPGAYRVEVYLPYKGKPRGWIFSNPIFITS